MNDLDYTELQKVLTQEYLRVSKPLIKQLGLETAAWIGDMLSKFNYFAKRDMIDSNGWFFNTQQNIKDDTSITVSAQTRIIRELQDKGVLEFEKRGIPSRNYYRFNFRVLINLITSVPDSEILVSQKSETSISDPSVYNKNKDNENKGNNSCSKEQLSHFDSQSGGTAKKSSLIRNGMAKPKPKDIPIDKPMNGPYKKIFDYWQLSGFPSPKTNTKTYEKNVIALRNLLKEHSIDEIIKAIDLLKFAISPDYTPASIKSKEYYKKLYFMEFVVNERTGRSIFKELRESPPKLLKNSVKPIPDPDPNITNFLKTFYLEKILGNANVETTVADDNAFRFATQKLIKFHADNQGKYPTPWFSVGDVARVYTDAVVDYLDKFKNGNTRQWSVSSFSWDYFFNNYLPAYMFDQAMLVKPHRPSPLNM